MYQVLNKFNISEIERCRGAEEQGRGEQGIALISLLPRPVKIILDYVNLSPFFCLIPTYRSNLRCRSGEIMLAGAMHGFFFFLEDD